MSVRVKSCLVLNPCLVVAACLVVATCRRRRPRRVKKMIVPKCLFANFVSFFLAVNMPCLGVRRRFGAGLMICACTLRPVGRNMHISKMAPPSAGTCLHGAAHVKGYLLLVSFFLSGCYWGRCAAARGAVRYFRQTVFEVFSLGRYKESVI